MVTSYFSAILKDLESYFKCPLEPDSNNSCLIKLKSGMTLQLEPKGSDQILIGAKLGVVPASAYQERVFKAALRFNDKGPLSQGVLGWSKKSGHLILFILIDTRYINADKLKELLNPFISKAKFWFEAIQKGNVPDIEEEKSSNTSLFGLIR